MTPRPASPTAPLVPLAGTAAQVSIAAQVSAVDEGPGVVTAAPFDGSVAVAPKSRLADYATLCKLRLNLLVLITTAVGYHMASVGAGWVGLLHVLIGTGLTAAASAVINQWMEVERDRRMPRTRNRPLPSGRVGLNEALVLGCGLGVAGLAYLLLMTPSLTFVLGVVTLASYLAIYTPLKTASTVNTLVGAVPGALPPVMGYVAAGAGLDAGAAALFGILFLWQIPHFLAIATLYREDYRVGGYRMLPVIDPDLLATGRQVVVYCLALLAVSVAPTVLGMTGIAYAWVALLLGAGFAGTGISFALHRTRKDARLLFFASIIYLPLVLLAMVVGRA